MFDNTFAFSWERLLEPAAIAGITLMALGMMLLCAAGKIDEVIGAKRQFGFSVKMVCKILAGVLVLAGALTAVLGL